MPPVRKSLPRLAILLCVLAAGAVVALTVGVPSPGLVRRVADAHPGWSLAVAVPAVAAATLLLVPRSAVAVGTGLLFGPWLGGGIAYAGALAGALLAFGLGRVLGRPLVAGLRRGRLDALDRWLARRGVLAVAWVRLVPVLPFGGLNYAFGTLAVRPVGFLAGTALGILPSTLVYAWTGSAATDVRSPAFLVPAAVSVLLGAGAALVARRHRPLAA